MIEKYHNQKLQTNQWHREEEPHNNLETPGRPTKQINQLYLPHQEDAKLVLDTKKRTIKHRTITDPYIGATLNNESPTTEPLNGQQPKPLGLGWLKCILLVPNLCSRFCCQILVRSWLSILNPCPLMATFDGLNKFRSLCWRSPSIPPKYVRF